MAEPKVDTQILELILALTETLEKEIGYYTKLYECIIDENDKGIVEDIVITKKKHMLILNEMYYRLVGERPKKNESEETDSEPSDNLPLEFRKAVIAEIANSEAFRSLIFSFLNHSIRDAFTEIMVDNQNNATKFGILLTKYS